MTQQMYIVVGARAAADSGVQASVVPVWTTQKHLSQL